MEENKNEELQSRREFFKKAAKAALPILGAVVLSGAAPQLLSAATVPDEPTCDCYGRCSGSCNGTCSGTCDGACSGTCKGSCKGTCDSGCMGGCKGTCKETCSYGCQGSCKGSSSKY